MSSSLIKSVAILPYGVNARGDVKLLLGLETCTPGWYEGDKWDAFGGRVEKDETPEAAAARECYEESAGVLLSRAELQQKIENRQFNAVVNVHFIHSTCVYYLLHVPLLDYPSMFRHTRAFIQYVGGNVSCIEKTRLRWFHLEELRREILFNPGTTGATEEAQEHNNNISYNRRPHFRRKFTEMMRPLFSVLGDYTGVFGTRSDAAIHIDLHWKKPLVVVPESKKEEEDENVKKNSILLQ